MTCGHAGCTCAPDTENADADNDEKLEPSAGDQAEPEVEEGRD